MLREAAEQDVYLRQQILVAAAACLRRRWRDSQPPLVQAAVDALLVRCLVTVAALGVTAYDVAMDFGGCSCLDCADQTCAGRVDGARDAESSASQRKDASEEHGRAE